MSIKANTQTILTILALVAFSQTMKYAEGDSNWSLLTPVRSSAEIAEGVHQVVTYTFVDILDFVVEEKTSLKSQLEFLLDLDLEELYGNKDFLITSKDILLAEIEKVVKKNFKALALGTECDVQKEIYALVKEHIQYQLYTNGWEVDLSLEALYSEIVATVNAKVEFLTQKLRQRVELMINIQTDTIEDFNQSGKPFVGLKNSMTKLLLIGGGSLIKDLINSITIDDPEYNRSHSNGNPFELIEPQINKVNQLIIKLKQITDQDPTDVFLELLKKAIKDIYKVRKDLPLQAQRDFASQAILALLGLAPSSNKQAIIKSVLRNIEDPVVSQSIKSPSLAKFKRFVGALPLEDVDVNDANLPALIVNFDKANTSGEYDPFNVEFNPYVERLLRINGNILNIPEVVELFRLSTPQTAPIFQTLYDLISRVRAENIDLPLNSDDLISKLIEKVNSGDWETKGHDLATIMILLNIEADPSIELQPELLEYLNLTNSSFLDLLKDDAFKTATKGIFEAKKRSGAKNPLTGDIDNIGKNFLITKFGKLREHETEYLANPLNSSHILKTHGVDLDSLYNSLEGGMYRGEELVVLLVNPRNSICYEQNLKDYFTSLI
jgi:hypothetical protein